jgi:hypothetical protein
LQPIKKQSIDSLDKARAEYERIAQLTTGQIKFSNIYVNSFYMLGKICEQRGDTDIAIEHFKKFPSFWKPEALRISDPGQHAGRRDGQWSHYRLLSIQRAEKSYIKIG